MKATEKMTDKRMNNSPEIVCIELYNEISLALESTPQEGSGEGASFSPGYLNNDPFRNSMG